MTTLSNLIHQITTFLSEGPLLAVFLFLCVVIFFRAQGTYWFGRLLAYFVQRQVIEHDHHNRLLTYSKAWLSSDRVQRGMETVRRRGAIVVTVSFLTVGFQSIANMSAGILRMPWSCYTAAMIPGGIMWAAIYATIGWTVWKAAMASAAGSPWGILVVVAILGIFAFFILRRKRAGDNLIQEPQENTLKEMSS